MKFLFQFSIAILIFSQANSYPELNLLKTPEPCPNGLVYYPNEDWTELICDCSDYSSQLYYPGTDSCYLPYTQGPCPPEHYLVLPPEEIEAKCQKNPCLKDGFVPYQGDCFPLKEKGPPCENSEASLQVEEYSFELKCI